MSTAVRPCPLCGREPPVDEWSDGSLRFATHNDQVNKTCPASGQVAENPDKSPALYLTPTDGDLGRPDPAPRLEVLVSEIRSIRDDLVSVRIEGAALQAVRRNVLDLLSTAGYLIETLSIYGERP